MSAVSYCEEDYRALGAAAGSMLGQPNLYASTCNVARSLLHSSVDSLEAPSLGDKAEHPFRFGNQSSWWYSEEQSPLLPESYPEPQTEPHIWGCFNVFPVLSSSVSLLDPTRAPAEATRGDPRCSFRRLQQLLLEDGVHLRGMKAATQAMSQAIHSERRAHYTYLAAVLARRPTGTSADKRQRATTMGGVGCFLCANPAVFWALASLSVVVSTHLLALAYSEGSSTSAGREQWVVTADLTGMASGDNTTAVPKAD